LRCDAPCEFSPELFELFWQSVYRQGISAVSGRRFNAPINVREF
jgi:hypothetical protein